MSQSKSFCILPWIHMHVSSEGQVFSCIEATSEKNVFGDIKEKPMTEIWNDPVIRELRLKMLSGELPAQCKKCHVQEQYGKLTRRLENNELFKEFIPLVKETAPDGSVAEMKFRYMDFRYSNVCNLRCKMCMPLNSTSIFEDFEKIYGPQNHPKLMKLSDLNKDFFPEVLDQLENVKVIYFAGGEPLLMEEHYEILERLIKLGRAKDVFISYNTNFTKLGFGKHDLMGLWKHFPNIWVYASIDGKDEQLAYLRKNASYQTILENRERVRREAPHVKFFVTPVLSMMNVFRITDLYLDLVKRNFMDKEDFLLYFLYEPTFFSVYVLPQHLKDKAILQYENIFKKFSSILTPDCYTMNSFRSAINFLKDQDHTYLLPEFKTHIKLFDEAQGTDFETTFPELSELLK